MPKKIIPQTRGFFVGIVSGHIGVTALDGTYLGISLVNLLSHLPLLGVTSAIDVLGVAALSTATSTKEVGSTSFQISHCSLMLLWKHRFSGGKVGSL